MIHPLLLHLYHRFPPSLRPLAASLRGLYLQQWRYCPETERLVEEALERDTWSPRRWQEWQEQRLASVLHRAVTQVPYYRDLWARRRRLGDRTSWEYLENWPILEKDALRKYPTAFVAEDCKVRHMFHERTAGTTGIPLDIWWSRQTVRSYYALCEARWRYWHGVSRHHRWAHLGGQLVTPVTQHRPPFWVWDAGLHQLYMSSFHLAPDLITHYFEALQSYHIDCILGYPSSLYALAREALQRDRRDLQMRVVVTDSEPLVAYQRQAIVEAFQCPVYQTYGMTEIVTAASECQAMQLHVWPEVGLTEVLERDQPLANGAAGDLVCTGLLNTDMPLIRYRVGDRGSMSSTNLACCCGRTLPVMASLDGRLDDLFYTADGRCIGGHLIDVFNAPLAVRKGQLIQETLERVRVRYVPTAMLTPENRTVIIQGVQDRMGQVEVILEQVEEIPRLQNGKFRQAICMLPKIDLYNNPYARAVPVDMTPSPSGRTA